MICAPLLWALKADRNSVAVLPGAWEAEPCLCTFTSFSTRSIDHTRHSSFFLLSARVSAMPGRFLWDGSRRGVRGIKPGLPVGRAGDGRNGCPNVCWRLLCELWDAKITCCKTCVKQVSVTCFYLWVSKEETRRTDWISVEQPLPWVSSTVVLVSVLRYKALWKSWHLTESVKFKFFLSSPGMIL